MTLLKPSDFKSLTTFFDWLDGLLSKWNKIIKCSRIFIIFLDFFPDFPQILRILQFWPYFFTLLKLELIIFFPNLFQILIFSGFFRIYSEFSGFSNFKDFLIWNKSLLCSRSRTLSLVFDDSSQNFRFQVSSHNGCSTHQIWHKDIFSGFFSRFRIFSEFSSNIWMYSVS